MAISIIGGIESNYQGPTDVKMMADNFTDITSLPLTKRWRGMIVYVNDISNDYEDEGWYSLTGKVNTTERLSNDNWEPLNQNTTSESVLSKPIEYASTSETPFPTTGGTGESGAIKAGNTFINNGSYWVGRAMLIAKIDTPGQNADNWEVIQPYIGYAPINVANRVTEVTPSAINFPNNDAVIEYVTEQLIGIKGTLSEPSDTKYAPINELVGALANKADLEGGMVPASQLPVAVDEILEGTYVNTTTFNDEDGNPYSHESNKYYVDITTNKTYRWSGSIFTPMNEGLALGETSSTAYRGDRGKTAYDHSQETGNPHNTALIDIDPVAVAKLMNVPDNTNEVLDTKEPISLARNEASAAFTIALSDVNRVINLNGTAAQAVTLPSDATVDFPIASKVRFAGNSTFAKTFVQGVDATVISPRGLLMDGFKGFVTAEKIAANTWFLSGDLIEPVTPITTTGTVTINTQVCNRLVLDMEGKEWKKFKYIGDDTWLGLDVINRVEGAQFVLEIERSTSTNMSMRFVQYSELYADTQIIDNAQLVIKGKATGRTLAKIAGQISTYSAGANAGIVNTVTYLERTNINS